MKEIGKDFSTFKVASIIDPVLNEHYYTKDGKYAVRYLGENLFSLAINSSEGMSVKYLEESFTSLSEILSKTNLKK